MNGIHSRRTAAELKFGRFESIGRQTEGGRFNHHVVIGNFGQAQLAMDKFRRGRKLTHRQPQIVDLGPDLPERRLLQNDGKRQLQIRQSGSIVSRHILRSGKCRCVHFDVGSDNLELSDVKGVLKKRPPIPAEVQFINLGRNARRHPADALDRQIIPRTGDRLRLKARHETDSEMKRR